MSESIDKFYQELKEKADAELMKIYGKCIMNGGDDLYKVAAVNTLLSERGIEASDLIIGMSFKMPDGEKVTIPLGQI